MSFLSPLAALVALAVALPLLAHALLEVRSRRVSRRLRLELPPFRSRLGVAAAIAAVAGLLGLAAAQPVISGTRTRSGRADAQVYVLLDTSRSMLARGNAEAPTRLARAKRLALQLRRSLPEVAFGIASLTDRVLPHLFPTLDADVFESTLDDSVGIERPPPAGTGDLTTDYNTLGDVATNNYYRADVRKRLLVVFSDGESRFFDEVVLGRKLEKGNVHVVFVHLWNAQEKIFLQRNNVDPGYRPDPEAAGAARRIAQAGRGEVLADERTAVVGAAKAYLGSGPHTKVREQRTRVSLGPYVALAALLPLGFVLLRRNL
jgi:von Willebrand factor type A domain